MEAELLERLGQLIDMADNLLAAATLPVPPQIHKEGLEGGMKEIRKRLFEIYTDAGGENVWPE